MRPSSAASRSRRATSAASTSRSRKDWAAVDARVCLAFPDVYDIGMRHLGTKILYSLLEQAIRASLAERAFAPWVDMEARAARARPAARLARERAAAARLRRGRLLAAVRADVHQRAHAARPRRHPAARRRSRRGRSARPRRRPDRDAPRADRAVHRRLRHRRRRGGAARARCSSWAAHEARRACRGASACIAPRRSSAASTCRRCTRRAIDRAHRARGRRRRRRSRACRARVDARVGRATSTRSRSRPTRRCRTPRPSSIARRSRSRAAAPRAAASARPGMIYRPVRERDPESIVDTRRRAASKNAGYDETVAHVRCRPPTSRASRRWSRRSPSELAHAAACRCRSRRCAPTASTRICSTRSRSVRATGLTFAPEAGTQRMRDVVNKNVTEEQHRRDARERVFSRGWHAHEALLHDRPADRGGRGRARHRRDRRSACCAIGRKLVGKRAEVTVSVSSHVPKPHTPFQWCALDTLDEIARKQRILRDAARARARRRSSTTTRGISCVEGILARGDRRLADVIERAWRDGARFDGWDEQLRARALGARRSPSIGVDAATYLGTHPGRRARLPWDHIDVGLEDGFLARRVPQGAQGPAVARRAARSPARSSTTRTSRTPRPTTRKLVCYDCGVACDLTQMRDGAPRHAAQARRAQADDGAVEPRRLPVLDGEPRARPHRGAGRRSRRARARASACASPSSGARAFISHLDTMRLLHPRLPARRRRDDLLEGLPPEAAAGVRAGARPRRRRARRVLRRAHRLRRRRRRRSLARLRAAAPEGLVIHAVAKLGRAAIRRCRAARSRRLGGVAAVAAGDAAHRRARWSARCRSAS